MKSSGVVVDASALAAVVFMEDEAATVARRLDGCELHTCNLLPHEMTNVAWKKARRAQDPAERMLIVSRLGPGLAQSMTVHPIRQEAVLELALSTGLTSYDASYLWLARTLDLPLVTLDDALARAFATKPR